MPADGADRRRPRRASVALPAACSRQTVSRSSARPGTGRRRSRRSMRSGLRSCCWTSSCRIRTGSRSRSESPRAAPRPSSFSRRVARRPTSARGSTGAVHAASSTRTTSRPPRSQALPGLPDEPPPARRAGRCRVGARRPCRGARARRSRLPAGRRGRGRGLVVYAGIWIATGLVALHRRPGNRVGLLMVALGFAVASGQLYWDASLPYTVFTALGSLELVITVHLFLAFPSGRLETSLERRLVVGVYCAWLVLVPLGVLMSGPARRRRVPGVSDEPASCRWLGHRCAGLPGGRKHASSSESSS